MEKDNNIDKYASRSGRLMGEDSIHWNIVDHLRDNATPYGDMRSVARETQFSYKSNFPLSSQRDNQTKNNNATITKQNGAEFRLRATTDANSEAILESKQLGDYQPGTLLRCGVGVRIASSISGKAEWGYFNGSDGVYFRKESDGIKVILDSGSTEVINKSQSDWNIDPMDGTGPSGLTLDTSDGHVYQTEIFYYGYGYAAWGVEMSDSHNRSKIYPVHREKVNGQILLQEPNLPVRASINSESTSTQQDIFIGGRQIESIGKRTRLFRIVSEIRSVTDVATSWRPTVSVKAKTNFENIFAEIDSLSALADQDMEIGIFRNATLGSDSFGDPSEHQANEVATQYDTSSSTTFTAANMIWRGLIVGGTGSQTEITGTELPDKPIVDGDEWTVAVKAFSGTGHTARIVLRIRENW